MNWKQIPLGPLQTNCYLLLNEHKECLIFDPGGEGNKLLTLLAKEALQPLAILLTHAHFDHIGAVDDVREHFNIPVYLHKNEAKWLLDANLNGSSRFGFDVQAKAPADKLLDAEQTLRIGDFKLQVFETPGHSPGSVSYYSQETEAVCAGDTLFMESIGRTDLRGGNHNQLLQSIHDKLLTLPENTLVLPGHGPVTSVENEMDSNPFLHGFS